MKVKNIFLVDDDLFFAQSLKKQLEKIDEIHIEIFTSVEKALVNMNELNPEIIFLDHELGGVNGVDAIPLFLREHPDIEIVVVSGQTNPEIIGDALDNGAKKYLSKDFLLSKKAEDVVIEMLERQSKFQSFWGAFINNYSLSRIQKKGKVISTILIIDDDEFFAQTLQKRLEKLGDYSIHHFSNVVEGLAKAKVLQPEIVFLDNILNRGPNGIESLSLWTEAIPNAEIAIMSTNKEVQVLSNAISKGASEFINKDRFFLNNIEDFIANLEENSSSYNFWSKIAGPLK